MKQGTRRPRPPGDLPERPFFTASSLGRRLHRARWQWALFGGFGLVYASIALVNHYLFRTAAFDLGIAMHAVYDYAHLRPHTTTLLLDTPPIHFLAIHFTLWPALLAPFYWVFGPWTLPLAQVIAILLGGAGVRAFARQRQASEAEANLALAFFFSLWGIYSALGFDYHDNVLGAMLLPWLVCWTDARRWGWAALAFGLLLVSKEPLALWGAVVALALAVRPGAPRPMRWLGVVGAVVALAYFGYVTERLMPALDAEHRAFRQLIRYQHLGSSLGEVIGNVLRHPHLLWQSLFANTTGDATFDYIKLEFWLVLLLSGGLATLHRPWYGLMLVPLLAQKLLANDPGFWGINYQYSIEFAPVLALAVVEVAQTRGPGRPGRYYRLMLGLAALTTLVTLFYRKSTWYMRDNTNPLVARHYRSPLRVSALHHALRQVPADVPLSAHPNLAPWLVNRARLYHFPLIKDARLVALLKDSTHAWPLSPGAYGRAVRRLRANPHWRIAAEDDQWLLLVRRGR